MMTGFKKPENEKGVTLGVLNNGVQDKELEKKDHGESGSVRGSARRKGEANEYLADLSDNLGLANWVAGEAREDEACSPRRTDNKKIEVVDSQVDGDGEGSKDLRADEFLAIKVRLTQELWTNHCLSTFFSDFSQLKIERAPSSDPQESSQQPCNSSEDDHIAGDRSVNKNEKKKKKKVNKCICCSKKGHLAKDCPEKDIVQEINSNFCLMCGNSGHDFFSCHNDYSADDLERIQCYICKAFGHLCCASYGNEAPGSVSCYSCGESDHLGSECQKNLPETTSGSDRCIDRQECKKLPEGGSGSTSALVQYHNDGENGHLAQEYNRNKPEMAEEASGPVVAIPPKLAKIHVPRTCIPKFGYGPERSQKAEEMSGPTVALPPGAPKLAKIPRPRTFVPRFEPVPHRFSHGPENHFLMNNPPYGLGYVPQNYVPRYNPPSRFGYVPRNNVPLFNPPPSFGTGPSLFWHNEMMNAQQNSLEWSTNTYPQQPRPVAPMAAAQGNELSSSSHSSQSSVKPQQSPES